MNLIKVLSIIPTVGADVKALGSAFNAAFADPAVKAEVVAHPDVAKVVAKISADWRTLENDVTAVQKSHFWTVFAAVGGLLAAAKKLEADAMFEQHDPVIGKAILTMPATLAALSKLSAKWKAVEGDIGAFG